MKRKIYLSFLAGFLAFSLASCGTLIANSDSTSGVNESSMTPDQRAIYEIFLKYSASGGNLTYEEWLDTIKGESGKDGLSLLTGHGAPSEEKGKTGDSYIDLDSWDFYVKGTEGWARQGNLKNPDVEVFTVKWLDYDGTTLESDTNVEKGSTPAYGGVTPTRVNDSKYRYTFAGWSPELEAVESDQVYVAQYDSNAQTYTVTWKNYDGTVLETDQNVDWGAIPTFDQAYPTRAEEESCTYEFSGWSPTVSEVIADQTYMATYQKTTKTFLVKFLNEDGSLLYSSMMSYGSAPIYNGTPTKKADAQYTYTFKGWDKDFEPVTSAATYSAVYDKKVNQYTVTWTASGYGTIMSEKVEYGKIPVAPEESSIPAKSSTATLDYSFYGWDKEIMAVRGGCHL